MSASFRERFQKRIATASSAASEDLWRYREAASVLEYFNYDKLQPFGSVSTASTAKAELLADCDTLVLDSGAQAWELRTSIRQAALHRLLEKKSVDAALAANQDRPDTYAQKLLERLLSIYEAPPRVVRARAAFGSPEENGALLKVVEWLTGVPEFEGKLPRLEDVRQRIAYERLLDPFRQLVGSHFAGRRTQLEDLADYVGFHDAYSYTETAQRFVEGILSIKDRPILFINGPGGAGKSTLIAKFILDHATVEQSSRMPFAYLDFDRVGLIAEEPITLLFDIMRQLAIQFPVVNEQYLELAQQWNARVSEQTTESEDNQSAPALPQAVRFVNRDSFLSEFAVFVTSLKKEDQPLLLVLDTFEEIQFRSTAYVNGVLDFLNQLQGQVPKLRIVLSGRAEIELTEYKVKPVLLGDFDHDAAISYLAGRGLTDTQIAERIFKQVGGSPLVLRLAADVAIFEEVDEKGISDLESSWFPSFQKQSIQAVLYKRILKHVYDERIERLAYPGLVLRVITPEVLQEVLGPACKEPISSDEANNLVKEMKARLSTILVPAPGEDNVLIHRPDMRSILLSDLKTTAETDTTIATKLTNIHTKAIEFYSKRKFSDARHRAEELYHRLALGIDRKVLKERWMEGLKPFLGSSIRELPPASQVYLAARLEIELPDELWKSAADEEWILYATRLVDQTLELRKPFDALEVLRERRHLWTNKSVKPLLTNVSNAVFLDYATQYEQLRESNPAGDRRTALMNSLVIQIIRTARELSPNPSYARELFMDGSPGKRLVAIAIANSHPTSKHMDLAITTIRNAVSPFEQYHALILARNLFERATAAQRRALLSALQTQEGIPISPSDSSRMAIKNDLLGRFSRASILSLDLLRAHRGDCLIVHCGSAKEPRLILVDGGPKGVYRQYLRPRLEQIRAGRYLSKSDPLVVDLLMVSHVDNDHMQGVLDLTRELLDAKTSARPPLVEVRSLWHNSFQHLIESPSKDLTDVFQSEFGPAAIEDAPFDVISRLKNKSLGENDVFANLRVLTSINQGTQLWSDANQLQLPVNREFNGTLITAAAKGKSIVIGSGVKLTVIGPMPAELKDFQKNLQARLKDLKTTKDMARRELASAYLDKSVPDLSSIVVMVEANGKRLLLTGDASGDSVLKGLEFTGLVRRGGKIHVDVLKVPNHGNSHNLYYDFFERVTADQYLVSGNGELGPDRDLFDKLMTARKNDDYVIHLTSSVAEIDAARKGAWENQQARERLKEERTGLKPRGNWSPTAHSIQALLDKNPEFARKIRTVEDAEPHVINLLDELGF